jgi:hypothetical protein
MVPARRVAAVTTVTAGLVVAGAAFGAAAGAAALTVAVLITEHEVAGFWLGALIGAPLGAIMAPVLAWGLLRRVPLGKMFAWCATGTVVGGLIGWIINPASVCLVRAPDASSPLWLYGWAIRLEIVREVLGGRRTMRHREHARMLLLRVRRAHDHVQRLSNR